jgi:flagellar protein FliO/FliZ
MNRSITPLRAALRVAIPALGFAVLACPCPAQAFKPSSKAGGENTPLHLSSSTGGAHASTGGASLTRTIVGLLIVVAVIWGLSWVLRQVKSGREGRAAGSGLASMATLPLGSGRSLHLVRAGSDYLLVGSAEHGVVPIYRYTEQQARDAGLLDVGELVADGDPSGLPGTIGVPRPSGAPGAVRPSGGLGGQSALIERLREWTVRR